MKTLLASLLFTVIPLACNNKDVATDSSDSEQAKQTTEEAVAAPAEMRMMDKVQNASASADAGIDDSSESEPIEQKIIKTATLRFETPDMDDTYSQIMAAAKKHGAQVQNDTEGKDYKRTTNQKRKKKLFHRAIY